MSPIQLSSASLFFVAFPLILQVAESSKSTTSKPQAVHPKRTFHPPCICNNLLVMTTSLQDVIHFRELRNKRLQQEAKVGIFCLGVILVLLFGCVVHSRMWRHKNGIHDDSSDLSEHTITASALIRKFRHRFRTPRRKKRRKSQTQTSDRSPLLTKQPSDSDEFAGFLV